MKATTTNHRDDDAPEPRIAGESERAYRVRVGDVDAESTRIEVAYRDLRYDPPKDKRVICRDDAQLDRWIALHGDNVQIVATTTDF